VASTIVDTNIFVYRHDPRDPRKQHIAIELLRRGIAERSIRIAYQAVVEFYAAVTRRGRDGSVPLLDNATATRETAWYDALMWAYADVLTEILSEDFQHGRLYGHVRVVNPFL
jgi:predicted nucleic acid-binding protein